MVEPQMEIGRVVVGGAHLLLVGMVLEHPPEVRVEMEPHPLFLGRLHLMLVVVAVGQEILVAVQGVLAEAALVVILGLLREQMEPLILVVEQAGAVQHLLLQQEATAAQAAQASSLSNTQ
jgi:hypothetical protein